MRLIVAGSRTIPETQEALSRLNTFIIKNFGMDAASKIEFLISGTARGADRVGERWAEHNSVPVHQFPADWDNLGNRAGLIRNEEMAEVGTHLIAIWDGRSRGTMHMINIARRKGLKVHVLNWHEK